MQKSRILLSNASNSSALRNGLSKSTLIVGSVVWALALVVLVWVMQQRAANRPINEDQLTQIPVEGGAGGDSEQAAGASVKLSFPARKLPDFEFQRATGGTLSLDDLKGKRWLADFVFTRCTSTCPTISRAMMELHDRVAESAPDVMFVTFTVDPKYDSVEVLKNYSETFTKGDWDRWAFLTGGQQEIFELIVNGFGLYVKENLGEARMPGFEVAHSNRVVLVNEQGTPVGTFLGTRPEDMAKLRRILTGREDFPEPGPGFSISRPDGQPLSIQLQAVPADSEKTDDSAKKPEASAEPDAAEKPEADSDVDEIEESEGDDSDDCSPQQPEIAPPDDSDSDGESAANDTATQLPDETETGAVPADISVASENQAAASTASTPTEADSSFSSAAELNEFIDQKMPAWALRLPSINAGLNSLAAVLLLLGLVAIKRDQRTTHRNFMISAFLTSAVFLACYLTYHWALGEYTGQHGKRFPGSGVAAIVYQLILWPHIVLAVFVPILAIRVFQHAFAERWEAHKKLARITFPIWMFVSITGVIIYAMLYHWPAAEVS